MGAAEVEQAIEELLSAVHFGEESAAEGITTVSLNEDGRLVEYRPDGMTTVLG